MTGKDLFLHPPLPPVCARISNPTTWPHICPTSPKYQWLTNKYIYAVMVHQMQNIQELLHAPQYSEKSRKKMFKSFFGESTDASMSMERKSGILQQSIVASIPVWEPFES